MKILIIGMGFAGKLYYESLLYLKVKENKNINLAYCSNKNENISINYFENIEKALKEYNPQMIIVTVNDIYHLDILKSLEKFEGIILCEKPFVANNEELISAQKVTNTNKQTIILSTVIRFSLATLELKNFIENKNIVIKRIDFVWKKNRINDYRPTVGVISEIVHPLDTVQWLFNGKIKKNSIINMKSNFASNKELYIPDTIFFSGSINGGLINGYSSFVSLKVERSIDILLKDIDNTNHYYINLSYDSPSWFEDKLSIYKEIQGERVELKEFNSLEIDTKYNKKLERLILMLKAIIDDDSKKYENHVVNNEIFELQEILNEFYEEKYKTFTLDYEYSEKDILNKDINNFDRIG